MTLPPELRAKSQCEGKHQYQTEHRALYYAKRCANLWQENAYVYPCDICGYWHISGKLLRPNNGYPGATAVVFPNEDDEESA